MNFLKIDAVGDWNQQDVQDWSIAKQQTGRPIVFDLSNTLDRSNINFWRQYSNAWRIDGDVQCYSACSTQVIRALFPPVSNIWSEQDGDILFHSLQSVQHVHY